MASSPPSILPNLPALLSSFPSFFYHPLLLASPGLAKCSHFSTPIWYFRFNVSKKSCRLCLECTSRTFPQAPLHWQGSWKATIVFLWIFIAGGNSYFYLWQFQLIVTELISFSLSNMDTIFTLKMSQASRTHRERETVKCLLMSPCRNFSCHHPTPGKRSPQFSLFLAYTSTYLVLPPPVPGHLSQNFTAHWSFFTHKFSCIFF